MPNLAIIYIWECKLVLEFYKHNIIIIINYKEMYLMHEGSACLLAYYHVFIKNLKFGVSDYFHQFAMEGFSLNLL